MYAYFWYTFCPQKMAMYFWSDHCVHLQILFNIPPIVWMKPTCPSFVCVFCRYGLPALMYCTSCILKYFTSFFWLCLSEQNLGGKINSMRTVGFQSPAARVLAGLAIAVQLRTNIWFTHLRPQPLPPQNIWPFLTYPHLFLSLSSSTESILKRCSNLEVISAVHPFYCPPHCSVRLQLSLQPNYTTFWMLALLLIPLSLLGICQNKPNNQWRIVPVSIRSLLCKYLEGFQLLAPNFKSTDIQFCGLVRLPYSPSVFTC